MFSNKDARELAGTVQQDVVSTMKESFDNFTYGTRTYGGRGEWTAYPTRRARGQISWGGKPLPRTIIAGWRQTSRNSVIGCQEP